MMCVGCNVWVHVFFFKQKTAYEMRISDWSSDVCSSDLHAQQEGNRAVQTHLSDRESRALHHPDGEPVEEEPRPERIEEIGDRDQPELRQREQIAPRRAAMPPGPVVTDFGDLFGRYSRLIGGAGVTPNPPKNGSAACRE